MRSAPTPWTVQYWEPTATGPDPGRHAPIWTPPLDQPGTPVKVIGWYVPSTEEPGTPGHPERVSVDVVLMIPPTFHPVSGGRIGLPGAGVFEVIGAVRDYQHGPRSPAPGNIVNLRKVVG